MSPRAYGKQLRKLRKAQAKTQRQQHERQQMAYKSTTPNSNANVLRIFKTALDKGIARQTRNERIIKAFKRGLDRQIARDEMKRMCATPGSEAESSELQPEVHRETELEEMLGDLSIEEELEEMLEDLRIEESSE